MKKEFNWETAEYPCFGEASDGAVVCFSSPSIGHTVVHTQWTYNRLHDSMWFMDDFKPYTPPKPKTKLWYFEYLNSDNEWFQSNRRMTEEQAKDYFNSDKNYKKLEALGFIEVEE